MVWRGASDFILNHGNAKAAEKTAKTLCARRLGLGEPGLFLQAGVFGIGMSAPALLLMGKNV